MMRPTVVGILALLALSFAPGAVLAQPRPEEPEDLEGEALSATSIRLVWEEDDGERAVSFNVYRDGDRIGDTTEEEYTDTGLTPSTEYEYWVRGVDSRGREGKRSDKVQVRTLADDTPPAKMSRPLATAVFATRIDLSWAAGSDPESEIAAYRLRRDGTVIATVTGRSYEDDGLKAFTEYEYRVSAINGVGLEGAQSSPLTRRTLDGTAPPAPASLTGSATSPTEISLDWPATSDPESGVSEYRVFRDGERIASVGGTDYEDSGLSPSTEYEYKVSAVNGVGLEGPKTAPVRITTQREPDTTPPTVPSGVQAEATSAMDVRVTWSASTDDESGVAFYRVYRDGTLTAEPPGLEFVDGERTPDTEYRYQVSAVNEDGLESDRSAEVSVRTPRETDSTPPTVPGGVQAEATSPRQVRVSWSASTDGESGVAGYRVYRDGTLVGEPTGQQFDDADLSPDTEYRYRVSAVNGDGLESDRSAEVSVRTPQQTDATPPTTPGSLAVRATTPTRIDLDWTAATDPESGVAFYRVYRDGDLLDITTSLAFRDEGLTPGATYSYEVSAVNGEGLEGPKTEAVSRTTPLELDTVAPMPPTGLRVVSP